MKKQKIKFKVNNEEFELSVFSHNTLLEILRDQLHLTGTKEGCDDGTCGACTVLIDDKPVRSCLVLALEVIGKEITTIEGLAQGAKLHPLQKAFIDHGGVQCGFCTPGMILAAKSLLDSNPDPTDGEIKEAISGNLCRCTGYVKIVKSIKAAAKRE